MLIQSVLFAKVNFSSGFAILRASFVRLFQNRPPCPATKFSAKNLAVSQKLRIFAKSFLGKKR